MRKEGTGMDSKEQGDLYFYIENTRINKELKMVSEKKEGKSFRKPIRCK